MCKVKINIRLKYVAYLKPVNITVSRDNKVFYIAIKQVTKFTARGNIYCKLSNMQKVLKKLPDPLNLLSYYKKYMKMTATSFERHLKLTGNRKKNVQNP